MSWINKFFCFFTLHVPTDEITDSHPFPLGEVCICRHCGKEFYW